MRDRIESYFPPVLAIIVVTGFYLVVWLALFNGLDLTNPVITTIVGGIINAASVLAGIAVDRYLSKRGDPAQMPQIGDKP